MQSNQAVTRSENAIPTLESARLFVTGREVRIHHCGQEYRLRLTGNNKLILTK